MPDDVWARLAISHEQLLVARAEYERRRAQRAQPAPLVCEECGKTSEGSARGWRALLTTDDDVATFCPACAREEFGDA